MNRPLRLHELTPDAAREHLRQSGRVLLPVGTMSFRAAHLPLGADSLVLDRLCDDLSARAEVPRAPVIPFGVHLRRDAAVPGVAALTRKTLHRVMNELIASWEEGAGVRETLILTAHPAEPHLEALSTIRAIGSVKVIDILGLEFGGLLDAADPSVRGGEVDTSLLLFLFPALIHDADAVARLSASREKGARIYDYILEQVEALWPVAT